MVDTKERVKILRTMSVRAEVKDMKRGHFMGGERVSEGDIFGEKCVINTPASPHSGKEILLNLRSSEENSWCLLESFELMGWSLILRLEI